MDNRIAIITDSACDLPEEYVRENDVYVLPLLLIYSDGEYRCGRDISGAEVLERLPREVPSTSQPSPHDIEEIFASLRERGISRAVFVLISSGLSGTYNMARLACEAHPDIEVELFDSRYLSMCLGYFVMRAVELRSEGLEFGRYAEALEAYRPYVKGYFYVPTLDYLIRGGRIGLVAGTVGKLLNIKPIISCNAEGRYYTMSKAPGARRALTCLCERARDIAGGAECDVSVLHGCAPEDARRVMEGIKSMCAVRHERLYELGASLLVHTGPGMLAVCMRLLTGNTAVTDI